MSFDYYLMMFLLLFAILAPGLSYRYGLKKGRNEIIDIVMRQAMKQMGLVK